MLQWPYQPTQKPHSVQLSRCWCCSGLTSPHIKNHTVHMQLSPLLVLQWPYQPTQKQHSVHAVKPLLVLQWLYQSTQKPHSAHAVKSVAGVAVALPVRLVVFVFPLGIVSCGYLLKWRRRYWLSKVGRTSAVWLMFARRGLYPASLPLFVSTL